MLTTLRVGRLAFGTVVYIKWGLLLGVVMGLVATTLCVVNWLMDVYVESLGHHTPNVVSAIKLGWVLFVLSEACLFVSLFWAWFHVRLSPDVAIGNVWPPVGITPLCPWSGPLLNTFILLTRGVTCTCAHHELVSRGRATEPLQWTIALGTLFSLLQLAEYAMAPFTISDSVYGSVFYLATGFHGAHVLVGTLMLTGCLLLSHLHVYDCWHHTSFECAALYWHFVDVVWVLLYVAIYVWGG